MEVLELLDLYICFNTGTSLNFAGFKELAKGHLRCSEEVRRVGKPAGKIETGS